MWYIESRRNALTSKNVSFTHAGLYLDKYTEKIQIKGQGVPNKENDPRQDVLKQAADITVPKLYWNFYARWQATLTEMGATCKLAQAQGRIAIGLGNESVQETAITLHHTYGVPYLPGSALKGLAASFAAKQLGEEWKRNSEAYRIVFGDTNQAGYITFFDAYPEPPKSAKLEDRLLHPDIMAIHHPGYYQSEGAAPADWDDPSMVPFPTATGHYLVALAGPPQWVNATFQILGYALEEMGIGAKTSSGYGRMVLEGMKQAETKQSVESYALAKKRLLSQEKPPAGRQRGTVTRVLQRPEGNFGFITPAAGGGEIYVAQAQLNPPGKLREQQIVEYTLVAPAVGNKRPAAQAVAVLRQPDA